MNQSERLRIKKIASVAVALTLAGIPLSSLLDNLNTNDYQSNKRSFFEPYEEHEASLKEDVLWIEMGKKKVKKKKKNLSPYL